MQRRDARAGCPWRRAIASPAARTAPSARRDSPRGPSRSTTRARATRTTSTGRTRRRRSTARVETRSMRTPARTPRPSSTRLRRYCALGGGGAFKSQIRQLARGPLKEAHDLIDRACVRRTTACRATQSPANWRVMTHPDLVSVMCRIFFAQPLDRRTRTRHGDADALGRVLPRCVYLASRMRPARLRRRLRARRPRERPPPARFGRS